MASNDYHVGVVGATGYTGCELVSRLSDHPSFHLSLITSRSHSGEPFSTVYPRFEGRLDLTCRDPDIERINDCDLVFLAVPHGTSMELLPQLDRDSTRIVDLAGDYRISDQEIFESAYDVDHVDPERLPEAVYGLAEYNSESIRGSNFVSNPGCYVTSALLPLIPLSRNGLVTAPVFVDSKSGISGAGRNPSETNVFLNVNDEVKPYNVGTHRHQAEMEYHLPGDASIKFVPHVVSADRGIESVLYFEPTSDGGWKQAADCLESVCDDHELLRYRNQPAGMKAVANSPYCDITVKGDEESIMVISCLDNLLKGAASQAIQNANLMTDQRINEGLTPA